VFKNDRLLGKKIDQRYEILSVIGIGGWSTVYRAQDSGLNRLVAIKILHSQHAVDQSKLQRFKQEAEAASVLVHPNLAVVYDIGTLDEGLPYIVMELIEGTTLEELIKKGERLNTKRCIEVFTQVCAGLAALQPSGLVHRDLKPSNIMVTASGAVKVLDFGVAKFTLRDGEALTQTDQAVGTPFYMSPEQVLGKQLDCRSDIYSLGCTMYEAVTGVNAFATDSLLECMRMQIQETPKRLKSVYPTCDSPLALEAAIFKALAKNPAQRFQSMNEFKDALISCEKSRSNLQEILLGLGLLSHSSSRRTRLTVATSLLALLLVAGALSLSTMVPGLFPGLQSGVTNGATRSLKFPSDRAVGSLSLVSHEGRFESKPYGVARGNVTVPADAIVMLLDVPRKDAYNLEFLTKLEPDDLQYLYIHDVPISNKGLQAIGTLKGLHSMNLERCVFDEDGFNDIELPTLGGLDLHNTAVSDKGLSLLSSSLPKVNWLSLKDTKVTDKGCGYLRKWQLLNSVDLSGTKVGDEGLSAIALAPAVSRLDISSTPITDNAVSALASMRSLKQLNVSSTALSDGAINRLAQALPQCVITHER
jgi:serine/threonine protein kinase